jgi:lysophospholipase L1-like esterase
MSRDRRIRRAVGARSQQSNGLAILAQYAATPVTFRTRWSFGTQIGRVINPRALFENSIASIGNDMDLTGLSDMTLTASIEVSGIRYPLTFNGSGSIVLKPGRSILHDALPHNLQYLLSTVSEFFYVTCPAMAAGMAWPINRITLSPEGNNSATGGDFTQTGIIPGAFGGGYGPSLILGDISPLARTFAIVGDSIGDGQGNTPGDIGYIEYGLAGRFGLIDISRPNERAQHFATDAGSARRRGLLADAAPTDAIYEYGINDTISGRSLTQLQADAASIAAWLRSVGVQRIYGCTLTPRIDWTGTKQLLSEQMPVASEANRLAYNAWLRTGAGGLYNGLIDAAASVEEGGALAPTGKWRVNGSTAGWLTADGVHPSGYAHQNPLKDAVQAALPL